MIQVDKDINVIYTDESNINMIVVGSKGNDLILIDTLPSNSMTKWAPIIKNFGNPKYILHNHCHIDHCEGDAFFDNLNIILFGRQLEMLQIENKRYPNLKLPDNIIELECGELDLLGFKLKIEQVGGHSFDNVTISFLEREIFCAGENVITGRGGTRCIPHMSPFGSPYDMVSVLRTLLDNKAKTTVPAHGDIFFDQSIYTEIILENIYYLERLVHMAENAHCCGRDRVSCPNISDCLLDSNKKYEEVSNMFHLSNWKNIMNYLDNKILR